MSRLLLSVVLLTLVYALVLGSFDPLDLLLGGGIALGMVLLFRQLVLPPGAGSSGLRPAWFGWFIIFFGAVMWEITTGAWHVLGVVLRLRPLPRTGIVAIPIESSNQVGIAVHALVLTIAPGTYLLDIDDDRRVMLIHALDASDPDTLRTHHHRFYQRYQRRVFP